jgi:transglutaminase-like putative cysteine protease
MPYLTGRPGGFILNPRAVSVQCVPAGAAPGGADWGAQARVAAGVIEPRIDASGPVQARAQALVGGRGGRWERIRALTEFVQRDIVYLEVTIDRDFLAGYRPHPASEVLRNRFGDCKDKATLLVSLLRSVGEEAHVVLVNAGNPAATAKDWPSLDFNHAIVALRADNATPADWPVVSAGRFGRVVLFDPTDSITPLGVLTAADQGGYVLVLDPAGGELVQAPVADPLANRVERTIDAVVGDRGELQAKVVETFHGMSAAAVEGARFGLGTARFKQRLVARVHLATPLAEAVEWTDQWSPASAQYRLAFAFQSGRYGRPMGDDMLMVSPRVLPETAALLPWQTRAEGMVWLPGEALDEEVRLGLPAGFAIEEMPENWTQTTAAATGDLSYRAEGGAVVYRCRLTRRGGFFDRGAYETLRAFEERLLQAERRPILVRRGAAHPPPPAAGN